MSKYKFIETPNFKAVYLADKVLNDSRLLNDYIYIYYLDDRTVIINIDVCYCYENNIMDKLFNEIYYYSFLHKYKICFYFKDFKTNVKAYNDLKDFIKRLRVD